ncbi:MAG: FGGY-family carbohydrate kinase [Mobilibacterium timonense]|uniref:xylulokinase n=1 Tax=Mobilibacterium timonense TaxID=1871012 RepID=UPI002353945E|nr:FGGY-family carbohydrate kinase [Mobilibacterium timonense]MBM6990770.1 FGGY-family carbohydrate kinase [Mobilibacterium timonense]
MYILAYDVGTTGVKTCLFSVEEGIRLMASSTRGYGLYTLENGGVEQDAEEWWSAMCSATREVMEKSGADPAEVSGISFCSQMQGLVLVDRDGVPVHRPMSYMDQRGEDELKACFGRGIKVEGANVFKLLKSLRICKAASLSAKDPVWKYKWIERNEPDNFTRAYKWLDVKEYLIARCTGNFIMTRDSAFATMLYDTRPGREGWSRELCDLYGVNMDHLPEIIGSSDLAGTLREGPAEELGLACGTKVFGGGGDAPLTAIGSGAIRPGETHIYIGTSGWVSTVVDSQILDVSHMIASIVGAQQGRFNYFAEMETAGKCLEWVKNHLALDEIGIFLEKKDITCGFEKKYSSLYDYLMETVEKAEPGAGGTIFTPWLHGNRCPFEDPGAAGMFFNIRLETGKTELIRSVVEGICYHQRWMLECKEKKVKVSDIVRFVGGGALSDVTGQMMADITKRRIEIVEDPQNVGAIGAAAVAAVGLGIIDDLDQIKGLIRVRSSFDPDEKKAGAYDRNYSVFKRLYESNKDNFRTMNS